MMRAGASLTENRFFNNCGGKLFAKTGPILLDSNISESVLRSLGVKATLTIQPGKAKLTEGEPECLYLMNRFYVQPDTTEEAFLEWIS